jgi:hypothetical protein
MHGPVLVWDMLVVSQRRMAASWRYSHDMWRVRLSYSPVGANSSAGRLHGAQRLWKGSPPSEEPFHSRMRLITVVPGISELPSTPAEVEGPVSKLVHVQG